MRMAPTTLGPISDILYLDADGPASAQMLIDIHVIRVPIQIQQVLETAWYMLDKKTAHLGMSPRPDSCEWLRWALLNRANYEELWNYGNDVVDEHYFRFGSRNMHPYKHGSGNGITRLGVVPSKLPEGELTPFPISVEDAIQSYLDSKQEIKYTNRSKPTWLTR